MIQTASSKQKWTLRWAGLQRLKNDGVRVLQGLDREAEVTSRRLRKTCMWQSVEGQRAIEEQKNLKGWGRRPKKPRRQLLKGAQRLRVRQKSKAPWEAAGASVQWWSTRIRGPDDLSPKGRVQGHYPGEKALPPGLQETDWLLSVPTGSLYPDSLSVIGMKFFLWTLS